MTREEYEDRMDLLLATERWLKSDMCELKEEEKQRRLEKIRVRKEMLQDMQYVKDNDELVLLFE